MKITIKKVSRKTIATILIIILLLTATISNIKPANAIFDQAILRLDRMTANTATGGLVCAEPLTAGTEADVQVTFPSGFTVNTTASNWTVSTTDIPAGSTAWPGIGTATAVSGQVVTFPSNDLAVNGTLYCFRFSGTNTLTTGSAGSDQTGTITTRTSSATTIDTSTYAVAVITNDSITVTATVTPTFSMTLSGNSVSLGTLSSSSVISGNAISLTIATNATNGWTSWVRGTNVDANHPGYAALNSAVANFSIGRTNGTATNNDVPETPTGTTDYGYILDVNENTQGALGTGNFTVDPEYNGADTNSGGTLLTQLNEIATSNGTTNGDILDLVVRAKINAVTPAASDYTDTLVVVAHGNF